MALDAPSPQTPLRSPLWRRWQEIRLIGQDPVLAMGLMLAGLFVFVFVAWPLLRVIYQGFFDFESGAFSLKYFAQYVDPYFRSYHWGVVWDTLFMGVATATAGTVLGFIFAYAMVRCQMPFPRIMHGLTLVPTISPPFAIAIAAILLFGRAGLVTKDLLGMRFTAGVNDIYGLDGLVFVQTVTFFPVAYLIIRAMLERLDPAMEEQALNLGASKARIFRTITLPLLIPGLAGSFLLLFVESLADLGNPLLLSGSRSVLSTEIFLAINGQYDQQKGAVLSLVLLVPTLTVFLLQRYWVSRRSYVAVTGKPTGGQLPVKEPVIRWSFLLTTLAALALVASLYISILVGSFTTLWGINYSLDLGNYQDALTRGMNAILSTTFLSVVATPIAGLAGMVIAFLVVRKNFTGKQSLDFVSNLGGAVPGTILGIGYIVAFIRPPLVVVALLLGLLGGYLVSSSVAGWGRRLLILGVGCAVGYYLNWGPSLLGLDTDQWRYAQAGLFLLASVGAWRMALPGRQRRAALPLLIMGLMLVIYNLSPGVTQPLVIWGRGMEGAMGPRIIPKLAGMITVFTQPTMAMLGLTYLMAGVYVTSQLTSQARGWMAGVILAMSTALIFVEAPLALVGTPYIVIAAYAVRSLPASVRAGVAALQQIDPAIEEASTNLGADAQYTFRHVTLPLILPAFIAGLIFAFARHMTSLSAIIFLTTAEWPILTVWILSEVEQGGMSTAAAYSVILITIVLVAIGLLYLWLGRTFASGEDVDLSIG